MWKICWSSGCFKFGDTTRQEPTSTRLLPSVAGTGAAITVPPGQCNSLGVNYADLGGETFLSVLAAMLNVYRDRIENAPCEPETLDTKVRRLPARGCRPRTPSSSLRRKPRARAWRGGLDALLGTVSTPPLSPPCPVLPGQPCRRDGHGQARVQLHPAFQAAGQRKPRAGRPHRLALRPRRQPGLPSPGAQQGAALPTCQRCGRGLQRPAPPLRLPRRGRALGARLATALTPLACNIPR